MNEDFDSLEAELAKMRPRGLTPELTDRIAAPMSAPQSVSWSDRFLICAIGSGAIAACVIVTLLLGEPTSADQPPSVMASIATPRAADFSLAGAQRQDELASAWK